MRAHEFTESICNCDCSKCPERATMNETHSDCDNCTLNEKTSVALCRSSKRLSYSDHCSCVSQGLRAHQSKGQGHTDGHGTYVKGHKAKSVKYGGSVRDYSGK